MGLLTGILTLPLAPVRGTIWIAEKLMEQAELELDDEQRIRRAIAEAELRHELGELTEEELEEIEDELLDELQRVGGTVSAERSV
jgi:hypothetical protein